MKTFKQFLVETAYHKSLDIQPGKPFTYIRNTKSAKKNFKHISKERFGQHIEPHGRYMNATTLDHAEKAHKDFETGTHIFQNPLYIDWGGGYEDKTNWKHVLHQKYKKKGKALSKAIVKDGYDGIVTVGYHNGQPHTSEAVDLTMFKQ